MTILGGHLSLRLEVIPWHFPLSIVSEGWTPGKDANVCERSFKELCYALVVLLLEMGKCFYLEFPSLKGDILNERTSVMGTCR